jgi:hypothetical protein
LIPPFVEKQSNGENSAREVGREGELTVSEDRDAELRRIVRVARLVHGSRDIFVPLLDATLIEMRSGPWTLTGFERVPDDALGELVAYQQSWLVMPRLHST